MGTNSHVHYSYVLLLQEIIMFTPRLLHHRRQHIATATAATAVASLFVETCVVVISKR